MRGDLFFCGRANFGNVLRTVTPMSSSVELAFSALVLWLFTVLDAVSFLSTVEALVASLWEPFSLVLLLLVVPQKGTNIISFGARSYLCRFGLIHCSAWASLLTHFGVHPIGLQIGADLFDGHKCGVVVCGATAGQEELVMNASDATS